MVDEHNIENYAGGEQSGREANRLEREALNDPFLSEALEGFVQENVPDAAHSHTISELRRTLTSPLVEAYRKRQQQRRRRGYWVTAIAASIALSVVAVFVVGPTGQRDMLDFLNTSAPVDTSDIPKVLNALPLPAAPARHEEGQQGKQPPAYYSGAKLTDDRIEIAPEDNLTVAMEMMNYEWPPEDLEEQPLQVVPFTLLDEQPVFMGNKENDFTKWMLDNLTVPVALVQAVQPKVYIKFVITEQGKVTNVEVLKSFGPAYDNEAVRVVSSSPDWLPGRYNNRTVSVEYVVPVLFMVK